jgi:hypothetical protein
VDLLLPDPACRIALGIISHDPWADAGDERASRPHFSFHFPVLVFHCTRHRTWIFFYLIVIVAILRASFLMMKGIMIWVSALLFIIAGGTSLFSFLLIEQQEDTA